MQIDAIRDALDVRVGRTFGASDVRRLQETIEVLGPFARLTIDFGAVRQCDDAALARFASLLAWVPGAQISVRGLTLHQWRLLTYLGVHPGDADGAAATAAARAP